MLWTIFVVILVLWLLGFTFHIAGGFIHILLVIALIVLVFNLLSGRRSALCHVGATCSSSGSSRWGLRTVPPQVFSKARPEAHGWYEYVVVHVCTQ